jgi:hypothetical protein
MNKAIIPLIIFIIALAILWQTFYISPYLDGIGVASYHRFLKQYVSSPLLFAILMKPYLYISLTLFRSIIPISIFFLTGLVMSKYMGSYWLVFAYSALLMLLNLPQLVFDSATVIGFFDFSLISGVMFVTSSYAFPFYAVLGYSLGRKYVEKSSDRVA